MKNIVLEISGNTIVEPISGVFHVPETCGGGDYILGRVARCNVIKDRTSIHCADASSNSR